MVFYKFNKKCIINFKIFICIFILCLFVFFCKRLFSTSYLEGLESNSKKLKDMGIDTSIHSNDAHNFCDYNEGSGSKLNNSCQKLTKFNCRKTECCIWQNNKGNGKCVAGSKENGPMFSNQ